MAATLGFDPARAARRLRRAALLHDIGKLGVSNRILDKPGTLTDAERSPRSRRDPAHTLEILGRGVPIFEPNSPDLAANHHEKLDGSGYPPRRLTAEALDLPMRTLVVADIFEALTADRPYRAEHADGEGTRHHACRGRHAAGRAVVRRARGVAARLRQRPGGGGLMDIRLSEIVAALSFALDLTEGQPMGHALRTCLIAMELGAAGWG